MLLGESSQTGLAGASGQMTLKQAERQAIVQAMESANFNQRKAARMLQVHRATLARKLRTHKLD
jgi:DNA-binding NtrC family response regulator